MALALSCSQKLTTASGPLWPRSSKSLVFFHFTQYLCVHDALQFTFWKVGSHW